MMIMFMSIFLLVTILLLGFTVSYGIVKAYTIGVKHGKQMGENKVPEVILNPIFPQRQKDKRNDERMFSGRLFGDKRISGDKSLHEKKDEKKEREWEDAWDNIMSYTGDVPSKYGKKVGFEKDGAEDAR